MGFLLERWLPTFGACLASSAYLIAFRACDLPEGTRDLFTAVISIAAIAVGLFAGAKATVVQQEPERLLIKNLRKVDRYVPFLNYMSTAINVSFFLAVLSAIGLMVDFKDPRPAEVALFAAWLFAAVFAAIAYVRVVRVLNVVLDQ